MARGHLTAGECSTQAARSHEDRPRCSAYIADSLDGFIGRADGRVDWLDAVQRLLAERQDTIELTDAAREAVADAGYDPAFSACPPKRALQRMVRDPLATRPFHGEFKAGDRVVVDEGPDGHISFTRVAGAAKVEPTVH